MNPKPFIKCGLLACIVTSFIACRTSQSSTYAKSEKAAATPKAQPVQLPSVRQEMQVEIVTPEKDNKKQ